MSIRTSKVLHQARQSLVRISFLALVTAAGVGFGTRYSIAVDPIDPKPSTTNNRVRTDLPGLQLVLVYIGNSRCRASGDPSLPATFARLRSQAQAYASAIGASFVTLGTTSDALVADGYAHLKTIGIFDEIVVGRNWANSALVNYVWKQGYYGATPGIAVAVRAVTVAPDTAPIPAFGVENERVIHFVSGLSAISHLDVVGLDKILRNRTTTEW